MGRKKKTENEIEEKTDVIDLEELDLDLDDDAEEASELELEDFDEEATVELELEQEAKPKKSAKKAPKKKPNKKKSAKKPRKAKTVANEEEAISEDDLMSDAREPETFSNDLGALQVTAESAGEDVTLMAGAVQQSMESMAKQWTTVKETTDQVSKNFERVSGMLGELPIAYDRMLQEMARQHQAKPPQGVKAALVASLVAMVLSGISLLYSQSVRQTVLDKPVAAAVRALTPKKSAPRPAEEIAKRPEPPASDLSEFTESTAKKKSVAAESRKKRKTITKKRRSSRRR